MLHIKIDCEYDIFYDLSMTTTGCDLQRIANGNTCDLVGVVRKLIQNQWQRMAKKGRVKIHFVAGGPVSVAPFTEARFFLPVCEFDRRFLLLRPQGRRPRSLLSCSTQRELFVLSLL